jgi:NAD(P)-dependent dehydrogenase (short-subunit alcohol dehydrogenase family)
MSELFDLTGRVALATGAGQGMGKASALALARAGADLLICDRNRDTLERTAAEIESLGRRVVPVCNDLYEIEQVRDMYGQLDRAFGRVDVVVNIPGDNPLAGPEDISVARFETALRKVLVWKFVSCQEAGRRMLADGKGSIINMASTAGVLALGRGNFAYSIAMAGVIQMTRELSTEWSGQGVRVNAIAPAQVWTPGWNARLDAHPGLREDILHGIPMGRMGRPEEIAGIAVFLASDASGFVTGSVISFDGGNLAMNAAGTHGPSGP